MDREQILEKLEEIAAGLDMEVRYETMRPEGGPCKVEGKAKIILRRDLDPDRKIEILADALRGEDLSGVFIVPEIRSILGGD